MSRKARLGRIQVIGKDGEFVGLDEAEQKTIDTQIKKDARSAEAGLRAKLNKGAPDEK